MSYQVSEEGIGADGVPPGRKLRFHFEFEMAIPRQDTDRDQGSVNGKMRILRAPRREDTKGEE